jgi:hypothetical protein
LLVQFQLGRPVLGGTQCPQQRKAKKQRLEGQAYGYEEDGTVKKPSYPYTPPSDEITTREA